MVGMLYIKSSLIASYASMHIYVIITIVFLAITLITAYVLFRTLKKSIKDSASEIQRVAKLVAENNDYSVRAKSLQSDPNSIISSFNQMLASIEQQQLELNQAYRENSKKAAIVASSVDAIIGSSLNRVIDSWNNSAQRILGYRADEMIGRNLASIVLKDGQMKIDSVVSRLKQGDVPSLIEIQFLTKDKLVLDASLTISPVRNDEGELIGLSHVVHDISKQKRIEQLIIDNEEHLRLATQAAEIGIFDWDLTNGTIEWDARCRKLFGIGSDEIITTELLANGLHPEDKQKVSSLIQHAFDKVASAGNYDAEYRVISPDNKMRWIRAMGKAFFDEHDQPVRFIGAALDITNKKREEIRKNEFVSTVSHELKTPLTSVKSYVQILLARARNDNDEFAINALSRTEIQTNKMISMIQDFLSLAKMEEGKIQIIKEDFLLHILMREIVEDVLFLHPAYNIELKDCTTIKIHADKDKIGHVILNLLNNAIKYSLPANKIILGCVEENDRVKVYVTDEGVGINTVDLGKLFDRFYRAENEKTKNVSGFGIGLYIASEVLRYHNSSIEVESIEGKGSTFSFYLDTV